MSRSCSADMPAAGSVGAREVFVLTAEAPAPLDTKRWVWSSWSLFRSTQPLSPRHLGSVVRQQCRHDTWRCRTADHTHSCDDLLLLFGVRTAIRVPARARYPISFSLFFLCVVFVILGRRVWCAPAAILRSVVPCCSYSIITVEVKKALYISKLLLQKGHSPPGSVPSDPGIIIIPPRPTRS